MIQVQFMKTVCGHFEKYRKLILLKMPQNYLYGVPLNSKTIFKF